MLDEMGRARPVLTTPDEPLTALHPTPTRQEYRPMASLHHTSPAEQATPRRDGPTSVYRYYDQRELLIYVGVTGSGMSRNQQHNAGADWWPYVARQAVEHHPTRTAALAREKQLIIEFRPPFNIQHNPDAGSLRTAYRAFADRFDVEESPQRMYLRLGRQLPIFRLGSGTTKGHHIFRTQMSHREVSTRLIDPRTTNTKSPRVFLEQKRCGGLHSTHVHGEMALFYIDGPEWLSTAESGVVQLRQQVVKNDEPKYRMHAIELFKAVER